MPTSISMGTTRNIRHGLSKLVQNVIPDMLECMSLGEQDGIRNALLILILIITVGTIIGAVIVAVHGYASSCNAYRCGGNPERDHHNAGDRIWILAFFILSLVTTMLMCAFTTTESVWRYYFIAWFVISYAIGLLIDRLLAGSMDPQLSTDVADSPLAVEERVRSHWLMAYAVAGLVLLYCVLVWRAELSPVLRSSMSNTEYDQIIAWMQENDCYYGYSTYETSNAITGYADGAVQVSAVADLGQMDICKWLTDRTWYGPYVPEDTNTAYVIPVSLVDQFAPMLEAHPEMELGLETEHYMVYRSPVNYSWQ